MKYMLFVFVALIALNGCVKYTYYSDTFDHSDSYRSIFQGKNVPQDVL